jgi:hypothetical protein
MELLLYQNCARRGAVRAEQFERQAVKVIKTTWHSRQVQPLYDNYSGL